VERLSPRRWRGVEQQVHVGYRVSAPQKRLRQCFQLAVHRCQLDPGEVGMRRVDLLDEGGDRGRLANLTASAHCEDAALAGFARLGEAASEPIEKPRASKHERPNRQRRMLQNSMLLERCMNERWWQRQGISHSSCGC